MKRLLFIVISVTAFFINGFSQTVSNSAPVKWENYKVSDKNLTVKFPKLPVKLFSDDRCRQRTVTTYYAYADEVVYKLDIFEKSKEKIPAFCKEKVKFTKTSFSDYLSAVQTEFAQMKSSERGGKNYSAAEKTDGNQKTSKWLLNDYQNLRWFELTVVTRNYNESSENGFVDSLNFAAESSAVEIADGASGILGDETTAQQKIEKEKKKESATRLTQSEKVDETTVDSQSSPLTIVMKPKPRYTDEARKGNITGNVKIRVTFLPNGAIGSIAPLSDLPYGLTEQAVEAAKKMAFLPQKQKNINVAVTKVVVYNFSIY